MHRDFRPWGFDAAVTHDAAQVATQAYRQFLGLDFHQLSYNAFARHSRYPPFRHLLPLGFLEF
jgi:hypothetical protein